MKATHTFCASNAANTTMDSDIHNKPPSSSVPTVSSDGGRAIDRHNPIIQDQKRLTKTLLTCPLSSTTPHQHNNNNNKRETIVASESTNININNNVVRRQGGLLGWVCTRPGDFISPPSSSRFLLTDKLLSDQFNPLMKQPEESVKSEDEKSCKKKDDDISSCSSPVKSPPRSSSDQQVVVLSVSLHCRGCEKKLRKHLSKMEGVTSFTIDFMAKKVTVVGNITPLAVLMSVSKVKNAKLLTPTTISSPLCDLGGGTQVLGNIKIFFGRGTLTKHYYKGGRSSICITRGVTSAALVISHEQIVVGQRLSLLLAIFGSLCNNFTNQITRVLEIANRNGDL